MDTIRVLVVDGRPGLVQGLLLVLRRRADIEILGPVADEHAALDACRIALPQIVVVNLDRSDADAIRLIAALRAAGQRVMAATRRLVSERSELAIAAGACGILMTELDAIGLVSAFRRAASGELVLPVEDLPALADRLHEARTRRARHVRCATLTAREREILSALARGATTGSIALELGISKATVQTHVKNILGKLGVHSRVEALAVAWRDGIAAAARTA